MIQVKICRDESELNGWLEEYSETCVIRDIKFGYCGTSSWTHERYMVIYETMPEIPEGLPFKCTDKELKDIYNSVNCGLQIGGI